MNRLPEDPEAEIMQRLRGESGQTTTPASGDDVVQEPAPDATAPAPAPGIAPDDQNQLERELEAPPPDEGAGQ
jgi:hypothetical protein